MFFKLPKYTQLSVCVEWFSMKDVAMIDSAVCSKEFRLKFIENIGSYHAIFHGDTEKVVNDKYLTWLRLRNVSVLHIKLNGNRLFNKSFWQQIDDQESLNKMLHALKSIKMECFDDKNVNRNFFLHLLQNSAALENLYISGSDFVDDIILAAIHKYCPRLKSIDLKGCEMLSFLAFETLCQGEEPGSLNTQLTSIDISHLVYLPDSTLEIISKRCSNLTSLNINDCRQYSDNAVKRFVENSPNLRAINLNNNSKLTDVSVLAIATNCPKLQQLHVANIYNMSDKGIFAIAAHCRELTHVNLKGSVSSCGNSITDKSVLQLITNCPHLQILLLSGGQITDEVLMAITNTCKEIQQIHFDFYAKYPNNYLFIPLVQQCKHLRMLTFSRGYNDILQVKEIIMKINPLLKVVTCIM